MVDGACRVTAPSYVGGMSKVHPLHSAALLCCVVSGCAPRTKAADPLPAVAAAAGINQRSPVDFVRALPTSPPTTSAPTARISLREGPSTADTLRPPPVYLIDDLTLGRRSDGTIDHAAAARALQQLDPRRIESIRVLKGDSTVRHFGPAAVSGVIIITTIKDTSRTVPRAP